MYYYHNEETGESRWEFPADEEKDKIQYGPEPYKPEKTQENIDNTKREAGNPCSPSSLKTVPHAPAAAPLSNYGYGVLESQQATSSMMAWRNDLGRLTFERKSLY